MSRQGTKSRLHDGMLFEFRKKLARDTKSNTEGLCAYMQFKESTLECLETSDRGGGSLAFKDEYRAETVFSFFTT